MKKKLKVTIWNEFRHEKTDMKVKELYPDGIHATIGGFLSECENISVRLAALDDEFQGLPDDVLNDTDVLIWWGHAYHNEVSDDLVKKVRARIYTGKLGLLVLHSGHHSKVFKETVGTNGNLQWGRNQKEIVWNMMPSHPIAAGIPDHFIIESEEMYGEPFFVSSPDALVFGSWFEDGNIFRSGMCFTRGAGKIFYFQPGHETCKSFYNPHVKRIIQNAVLWAAPNEFAIQIGDGCVHSRTAVVSEF